MPFDKVDTQIDFPAQERAILAFWDQIKAFETLREQNRGKPKWSFLDGPITANNPMGVHHAWGRTYKDAYQRYFAMSGHEERYQNGFDCQGLWVEVEVEKELGLKSKRDIENLVPGDRFAVGLSQMEMHEGYQRVAHQAVFVRFPLRGRPGENLLIWTTTPWTLSSNVAAAVNPNLTYLKLLHKDQAYYLAKGAFTAHRLEDEFKRKEWVEGVPKLKTLEQIFKEKGGYEIAGEILGKDMVGWTYDGPFDELDAQHQRGGFLAANLGDVHVSKTVQILVHTPRE